METKYKILLVGAACGVAFAVGRYTVPEKVRIETKIVEVKDKASNKTSDTDKDKHKKTTVTEKTFPDGHKEVVTVIEEDTQTNTKTNTNEETTTTRNETQTKEITRLGSLTTISLLAGAPLSFSDLGPVVYGAHISKPILGPITIGIWGLSNKTGGLSVGIQF